MRKIASIPIAAHDLSDGLNTVMVVLSHGNPRRRALFWLAVDMFAPVFGAGATLLIDLDGLLPLVLAFFAGSFLYIGASDLLAKAKEHESPLVGDSNQKAQRRRARRCFKKTVALAGFDRRMIVEDKPLFYHPAMPSPGAAKPPPSFRRNTQQRREIREVFERNDRPLAADEVLQLAQEKVVGLGIATVYRTINALTDEGWLVAVEVPGAPPRYEVRGKTHHHHFHCLKCYRLFELDACLEHLGKMIPPAFRAVDHVVLIYGFCADCDRGRKAR